MHNQEDNLLFNQEDNLIQDNTVDNQLIGLTLFDLECIFINKSKLFQVLLLFINIPIISLYYTNYLKQQVSTINFPYLNQINYYYNNSFNYHHSNNFKLKINLYDISFILITIYCCLALPYLIIKLLLYYKLNYSLFFDIRNNNEFRNNIINFQRSIANLKRYSKIVNFFQLIWFFASCKKIYIDKINNHFLTFLNMIFLLQELFPFIIIFSIIYLRPRLNNQSLELFFNNFNSLWDILNFILFNQNIPLQSRRLTKKQKLDIIVKKMTDISKDDMILNKQTCTICFEDYQDNMRKKIIQLPCQHIFHKTCFLKWTKYKTTCPICRLNLLD